MSVSELGIEGVKRHDPAAPGRTWFIDRAGSAERLGLRTTPGIFFNDALVDASFGLDRLENLVGEALGEK